MPDKPSSFLKSPGIVLVVTYFILFAVNSAVLYLASFWFPQYFVLGTMSITKPWAIAHSMGILAIINTFATPFINYYETSRSKMFAPKDWMIIYFAVNFVGVWLVTRFADNLGFGITSWLVVAILALALDVVQGAAMMQLEKLRTK